MMSIQSWRTSFLFTVVLVLYSNAAVISKVLRERLPDVDKFPSLEVIRSLEQPDTNCTGIFHSEYSVSTKADVELNKDDEALYLSWEIAWPATGKRVDEFIRLDLEPNAENTEDPTSQKRTQSSFTEVMLSNMMDTPRKSRQKRRIFHTDNRFYIPSRSFGRRFPFSSVVKLSTGCTGTLVSPKHVLTAAHCLHDQSDYVTGFNNLKVAVQPVSSLIKKFRWIVVNNTHLPNGWLMGNPDIASRFDYALLELDKPHNKPYFELGISNGPSRARIHFTAFEDDKPAFSLWYRKCLISETDEHVLYHRCDAMPGSSGAGVYAWAKSTDGTWSRKLIGIFSGNRWRAYKEWYKRPQNFNAAIRLNTLKYTQICGWMGEYAVKSCKQNTNSTK